MNQTPGLFPNIRLDQPTDETGQSADVVVEIIEDGADKPVFDKDGNILEIKHADGSVTISLDGKPIESGKKKVDKTDWFRNLSEEIDKDELSRISSELMRGIRDDLDSRKDWIEDRAQGVKLWALRLKSQILLARLMVRRWKECPGFGILCCWKLFFGFKPTHGLNCCRLMGR